MKGKTMPCITRILCPIDFSENSLNAFRYADDFASWVGADLVLLHAFSKPASYDSQGQWEPSDTSITTLMEDVKSSHDNVSITRLTHAGEAGEVICWGAEDQACNLIIMGTHGRGGVKRALLGSIAEHVLRNARCPVMTVREQKTHVALLPEPMVMPSTAPPYM
jgi:nucleotide-binding universal stress UspA family protein